MEHNLHTVKITGQLTFDSRHPHFRSAFKDFIEKEGLQLQITDMVNTDLPSMEIGVKLTISNDFVNFTGQRYAEPGPAPAKVIQKSSVKSVKPIVEKLTKQPKIRPVNPDTGSDTAFY